ILDSLDCLCGLDVLSSRFTGRGARSQRLSWNRAWGRGSPGARGEGGQRTGSAPGAGRSRAARVGSRVEGGMGGGRSCAWGTQTAAGKVPGAWQGGGDAGGRGSGTGSWRGGGVVQVVLRGSPVRLGRYREQGRGGAARGGGQL